MKDIKEAKISMSYWRDQRQGPGDCSLLWQVILGSRSEEEGRIKWGRRKRYHDVISWKLQLWTKGRPEFYQNHWKVFRMPLGMIYLCFSYVFLHDKSSPHIVGWICGSGIRSGLGWAPSFVCFQMVSGRLGEFVVSPFTCLIAHCFYMFCLSLSLSPSGQLGLPHCMVISWYLVERNHIVSQYIDKGNRFHSSMEETTKNLWSLICHKLKMRGAGECLQWLPFSIDWIVDPKVLTTVHFWHMSERALGKDH